MRNITTDEKSIAKSRILNRFTKSIKLYVVYSSCQGVAFYQIDLNDPHSLLRVIQRDPL